MRRRKIFAVIVVLAGVAPHLDAQHFDANVSAGDAKLYARLMAMTDTRTLDTTLIARTLASSWRPLRAAAALAIGQIGAERGAAAASRLRALLRDGDPTVRANAAYALGLLKDSASITPLSAVVNTDPAGGPEAAWALGEIGAPARTAITTLLRQRHDPGVSLQLLLAAAKLRPLPIADVRSYLRDSNPAVVWAAAYAIARTRAPSGVKDLIELETSRVARGDERVLPAARMLAPYGATRATPGLVRAEIARGLASSAAGDSLRARALVVLTRLASDSDPHVRINAVRSLGTYRVEAESLLVRVTRDPDPNVRVAAAQSFATTSFRQENTFATVWAADTSIVYRSSLLASATRAGLRPAQLREWASSSDWRLRAAVASAGGDTLDRAFAISRVYPLLADRDPRVREAAYGALPPPASVPLEDSVHAVLIRGLQDPDFYVRATVLGALTDRPAASDLGAVLSSYRLAARDSANDARLAAIQYVAALWKKDSASLSATALSQLSGLPVPSDPLERSAGKEVPAWSRWASVAAMPRTEAWYDSLVREMVIPAIRGRSPTATIQTVRGPIRLELFSADAPVTVWNFLSLARSGYYRNTRFHRVVPNFVAQDGDPRDDGNGGPGYAIRDEMNRHRYERGAVGMALSGPDTGGSQYFITHSPQPHLDGHYTVFGRVIGGYDVLDKIVQGDLIRRIDTK